MTDRLDHTGKIFGQRHPEPGVTQNDGKGMAVNTINRVAKASDTDVEVVEYIVMAISEFAKRHLLTIRESSNYLLRFKGIDFLERCYPAEHTLSLNDCIDDITAICKRNGGKIG